MGCTLSVLKWIARMPGVSVKDQLYSASFYVYTWSEEARWGFLWRSLPSLPRAVNTDQMLRPREVSRVRSLFAIISIPVITSLRQAVFLVCSGVRGALCGVPPVKTLLQLLASMLSTWAESASRCFPVRNVCPTLPLFFCGARVPGGSRWTAPESDPQGAFAPPGRQAACRAPCDNLSPAPSSVFSSTVFTPPDVMRSLLHLLAVFGPNLYQRSLVPERVSQWP